MKTQWQQYKELELLPDGLAKPQTIHSPLVAYLDQRWRSLLNQRASNLDYEYQVEYLERRLKRRYQTNTRSNGASVVDSLRSTHRTNSLFRI